MKTFCFKIIFLILIIILSSCNSNQKLKPHFEHNLKDNDPKPWTSETFEESEDDFTFAIISDLNGGEREGIYNVAVAQINRLNPTFVLSVGDLIDGGTEDSLQLKKEWDDFGSRTSNLDMPFFYLGGNHDLTNPKMRAFWKQRFGPRYYHFVYKDVLFLMMDSEDFEDKRMLEIYHARAKAIKIIEGEVEGKYEESEYYHMPERKTGAMSNSQLDYYKLVLNQYPDVKWTFVLMHKPLWMREDDKGLRNLENALSNRHYTVINGHFHSFSHRIKNEKDYIILGTTGGSQGKEDTNSFDHITLVRMAKEKPVITHLKMDGILNERGGIPLGGDSLSFQASKYK